MARQIAVSAVAGAGLEIIFGDFLKMVLKARKNNSQFEPSLKRLEEMLNDMTPNIKRIDSFNRELDQPEQLERLKGLVTKGNDLVSKCSKIHNYNYLKRPIYNKKLLKLEKDIRDHISSVLQLQVVADTKESLHTQNSILVAVKGVSSGVRQSNDQIGKSINGGRVDSSKSYSNTILAGVCSPPLLKVDPVGLEIPLSDLRIKLLNDETSQHIVLSAPGGCGKTTLATALCQQGDVKDKFKSNILFVNVPKLRNLMIIVKMIFQHKEIESPDFRSEEDAANHLERLFQQIGPDPILLVLDDVWPVSESILDMLKFRIENYKILVTSRYEFRSFGSTYKLKTLNPADAMTLFQKLALPRDQLSYAPDHHILEEMVKWCRGFPLVISVVGKSLCRKSAAEWRKRHRECSKAVSILSDYDKILDCLQSSVEAFNDDVVAKECFMDLGSFPEDQRIPATTLIDMWAELYNLDEDNAIANLHELSDRNLIEVVVTRKDANEDDGSYNEHFVTQHDLLRELAIRESNSRSIEHRKRVLLEIIENKIPEWLMEQDQLSIRAKLLSISTVAGAGLEIIFGDFLKMVLKARKNNSQFEPSLKRLEEMLNDMTPNIKRIDSFNRELDQPEQLERLKGLVTKGNDLVSKCSKIHNYNYLKRPIYNKKLLKLEKDIRDHISSVLQLQVVADTKESLHTQNSILVAVKAGVCSPPLLKVDPVGLEIPLSDLRIKLLNDETSQHIVLSAPGGCGKTTLATALCQQGDVKDKFKSNILFVNVPKLRNLMIIVKMIFQHKEIESPDFRSEEDAANHLERLFQQIGPDPILLVLDDVWPVSESILDMLKFRIENYKILVTSRYEFRSFGSTYKLKTLNPADAMTLFQKLALPRDQLSYAPDHHILEEMVKWCRGFPLVISVVGKSLCRKSAAEWRKRHRECSKAVSILSDYDKILDCLQSSVEAFNDDVVAKECFMDLGSFPEDQRIPATTLIDMWAELYNLDEDNAIANLHELSDRNLIEVVVTRKDANEDDGSYNEHFVTQHDLLRELAIRESNSRSIEHRKRVLLEIIENKIPEWLMEQDQLSIRAKLLSISTDEKFSSSWSTMQAPEVEVLLLNFQTEKFSLPEFIERMNKLKVLVLHNYGFVPAELSNFPLLGSLSNLKRIRLEKVSIPSLFLTSMKWRKLEKMSLVMCNIDQAFNKSTNKISDAFPKLVELTIDYCNDLEELPTGFCDLVLLRKLRITNCHKLLALPEDMGNLLDLEVLRLNSCIELTGLPGSIGRLHKLQILDLSECLSVTELPEQIGQLHDLRKLYMIECSSCELPSSVENLVRLKEVIGDQETAMSWNRFKPCLPSLTIKVHKENNLFDSQSGPTGDKS
ncbi:hypothetical protein NC652_018779 [Populus alba x Populus x berolinensis]|nr:hypothetical protein NC652_018779 [Populus alba x Populus x berolinensis]